jgi:hypothetical protein
MPIRYTYEAQRNRVETTCEGEVRVVDVVNHLHLLGLDPKIESHADVLLALSDLDALPEMLQVRTASDAIGRLSKQRPFGRCAIVVGDEAASHVARMFETVASSHFSEFRIFPSRNDASAWLDLPEQGAL